jgi:hypothetical protein
MTIHSGVLNFVRTGSSGFVYVKATGIAAAVK